MSFWTIGLIAIGLAMDAFAVSLGIGAARSASTVRPAFRIFFHFGLFQAGMTLLGWLVGSSIARLIASFDHWIAFALLAWVGIRMIHSGLKPGEEIHRGDPTRGAILIMLCVATSLDALAVGLSLAMLRVNILSAASVIGIVAAGLSLLGLLIGNGLGKRFGKSMEILGGLILIGIGLRILYTHLF